MVVDDDPSFLLLERTKSVGLCVRRKFFEAVSPQYRRPTHEGTQVYMNLAIRLTPVMKVRSEFWVLISLLTCLPSGVALPFTPFERADSMVSRILWCINSNSYDDCLDVVRPRGDAMRIAVQASNYKGEWSTTLGRLIAPIGCLGSEQGRSNSSASKPHRSTPDVSTAKGRVKRQPSRRSARMNE